MQEKSFCNLKNHLVIVENTNDVKKNLFLVLKMFRSLKKTANFQKAQ